MKDEREFLPAALEIQETPPLAVARWILWAVMIFFVIAVTWAWFGYVDIVGVAQGKIVPGDRVKVIQPLERGTVQSIHVSEGDRVGQGQVLIELDPTLAGADHESLRDQLLSLRLERARLLSILDRIDNKQPTANYFSGITEAAPGQIRLQRQRIKTRLGEYRARRKSLIERVNAKDAEREAVIQRIEQLNGTIPLITERADSLKKLMVEDMVPRVQWLELEQERIEQVKERDIQRNRKKMLEAGTGDVTRQLETMRAEFESRILAELSETENRLKALRQEQVKAKKRVALQQLTAPVSGRVHQLTVHTIGGVVTPAQELMHIVPDKGAMEVEAWVQNKDIGFVHEDQPVEIKVQTFPFTKYGTIAGEILNISDDATQNETLGLVYQARIGMEKAIMNVGEKIVNLTPGMAVTVEINMGKRRLIEFLLSPLLRYKNESMKER